MGPSWVSRGWGSQHVSDHGLSTATGLIKYQMFVLCVLWSFPAHPTFPEQLSAFSICKSTQICFADQTFQ